MIHYIVLISILLCSFALSCMDQGEKGFLDNFDIEINGKKGEEAWAHLNKFLETSRYCTALGTEEDALAFHAFMEKVNITPKNVLQSQKPSKAKKRKLRRKRAREARKLKQQLENERMPEMQKKEIGDSSVEDCTDTEERYLFKHTQYPCADLDTDELFDISPF